jgi:antitoxin (DNA-binding transcriptional repressor) of toxin-antitoxin stability system
MRSVGLEMLKNRLSEYVRLAAAGETVLVTDHDRVVAEIVPPQPGRTALRSEDDFIAQGVREGWLTPATAPPGDPPPRKPAVPFDELMADLEHEREAR